MIDAEKLKELAEKATDGKWYVYGPLTEEESCVAGGVEARIIVELPGYMVEPGVYETSTSDELSNSDLELAVELRNSLPAILALVEREGKYREALETIANYDPHAGPCKLDYKWEAFLECRDIAKAAMGGEGA